MASSGRQPRSAPGLRTTSRLIDEPARRLLAQFSEPAAVTAAVLATARDQDIDPVATLESAVPLLEALLRSQLLIRADAPVAVPPGGGLAEPGSLLSGWEGPRLLGTRSADTGVYLVSRGGQQAVLKIVSAQASWQKAAIRNELAALQEISHPAVRRSCIDGDADASAPYLILQLRPGSHCTEAAASLRRLGRHAAVSCQAAGAAGPDHGNSMPSCTVSEVIHGDVQPRNVLADADTLEVSVLDFGFARRADGTAFGAGGAPQGGVDCYRAPERWRVRGAFRTGDRRRSQPAVRGRLPVLRAGYRRVPAGPLGECQRVPRHGSNGSAPRV